MAVKAIAHSYWRTVRRGTRTFESVPDSIKADVRTLAQAEVASGAMTADEYLQHVGEAYEKSSAG